MRARTSELPRVKRTPKGFSTRTVFIWSSIIMPSAAIVIGAVATLVSGDRLRFLQPIFPKAEVVPSSRKTLPVSKAEQIQEPVVVVQGSARDSHKIADKSPAVEKLQIAKPEAANFEVIANSVPSTRPEKFVALIAFKHEGQKLGCYDQKIEAAIPPGKFIDSSRFSDRAASTAFTKAISEDGAEYFRQTGFKKFANYIMIVCEESRDSGLGNGSYVSTKVAIQIKVINTQTGAVTNLKKVESVGAGFTQEQALNDAREKVGFSTTEMQRAFNF